MAREIRIDGDVAYVPLTRGYEATIDASDVALVSGWKWCAHVGLKKDRSIRTVYAVRTGPRSDGRITILMHRVILGVACGLEVDHKDGDGMNNRRTNLRSATKSENQMNARPGSSNKSGVRGVYWHTRQKKWVASIVVNKRRYHLGYFMDISSAAAAYAKASAELHGEFGRTS